MKRPFWMHHLVEYILGIGLVAVGTQSPTPEVPALLGAFVLIYAACTKSAIGAFRILSRRAHKVTDPIVVAIQIGVAAQPWVEVDPGTRMVIVAVAIVHLFVWWQSSYDEKVKPSRTASTSARSPASSTASSPASEAASSAGASSGDRATEIGRTAGRLVGGGVKAFRGARDKSRR